MAVKALNLSAKRGEDLLFQAISFTLSQGEALVVTGRNGTGKSTLLRVLAGLLRPHHGSCHYESVATGEMRPLHEASHYLGHKNGMKADLTVGENLAFWQKFLGHFETMAGMAIDEAAERVALSGLTHLPYGYLSAGQQRRFAMARLLIAARPVWILDEPTAALDARADALFADLVSSHLAKGGIVIAATHQALGFGAQKTLEMKGFAFQNPLSDGTDQSVEGEEDLWALN